MSRRTQTLNRPAAAVVREHALDLLAQAAAIYPRLAQGTDPEGLHDFRVSLRKLRTWLRAWEELLPLRRRLQRALRDFVRATNAARDAEVAQHWIGAPDLWKGPTGTRRWLTRWLAQETRSARRELLNALSQWPDLHQDLLRALDPAPRRGLDLTFAAACACRLRAQRAQLEADLAQWTARPDEEALHRTRIEVKRLRYLLDPLRALVKEADRLARHLSAWQDRLGDLRDHALLLDEMRRAAQAAAMHNADIEFTLASGGQARQPPAPLRSILEFVQVVSERRRDQLTVALDQSTHSALARELLALDRLSTRLDPESTEPQATKAD